MQLIKIFNGQATFKHYNSIVTVEIDEEAEQILNYYNRIPANS